MARPTATASPPISPADLAAAIPGDDSPPPESPPESAPEQPRITQEGDLPPAVSGGRPSARGRGFATSKPTVQTGSPQSKRELDRMLPSGLKVHISKRLPNGELSYCGEYSATEVQGHGTIESFIKRYLVPEYEYGEYEVLRQDAQGNMTVTAKVRLEEPASHRAARAGAPQQQKTTETLREMFDILKEQEKLARGGTQVMRTPMDELAQNWKAMKEMGLIPEGKALDPMMSMMMMRMMGGEQQPKSDPALMRLLEKMGERLDHIETMQQTQTAFTPLPAPPPPPPDPLVTMQPIFNLFQEGQRQMADAIRELGRSAQRDPVKDLADLRVLLGKDESPLTPATMLAMIPQMRDALVPASSQDPFQKTLENFRLFRLMQEEFSGGGGEERESGPPEENFWSFAKSLFNSPAGAMVGQAIKEALANQGMQQQVQQQVVTQRQKARDISARREAEAAQAAAARQAAAQAQQRQAAPQPAPAAQDDDDTVEIPPGFLSVHAPKINAAATAQDRCQAMIESFQLLGTSADFRPVVGKVFFLCQHNRKMECLAHLREILEFFANNEILDPKVPDLGVADFDKNWNVIRRVLKMPDVPEVYPDGYTPPTPPAEVASSPPARVRPVPKTEPMVTPSTEGARRLNGSGSPPVPAPEPEKVPEPVAI